MSRQPEQTIEQFEIGSRKLAKWGSLLISLAGGEPLLRNDIVEIVAAIGRHHFPFITTNGYNTSPDLARELFAAGLWGVSVSIDYAEPERHDRARGTKDAFKRAVRALEIFSKARRYKWQRINLISVLMHDNLDQVESLIKLAAQHDAYFMIQPYCTLKTGSNKFLHHANELPSRRLMELRNRYPNFLSNPYFLEQFDTYLNGGVPNCRAGGAFFNIDSTGDIAVCVENRAHPVANLYQDDMSSINSRLRNTGRNIKCRKCWYNCRGEVESLYNPKGLFRSLPTLLFDRGQPEK